eukprot:11310430-Alexandrium_andersonii.AAC.1
MSASLVGSEMCIRDRRNRENDLKFHLRKSRPGGSAPFCALNPMVATTPVSYTHLTLPTICSV